MQNFGLFFCRFNTDRCINANANICPVVDKTTHYYNFRRTFVWHNDVLKLSIAIWNYMPMTVGILPYGAEVKIYMRNYDLRAKFDSV